MERITLTLLESFPCLLIPILFGFLALPVLLDVKIRAITSQWENYRKLFRTTWYYPSPTHRTSVQLFLVNCTTEEFMKTGLFLSPLTLISSHWYTLEPFKFNEFESDLRPFDSFCDILFWQISSLLLILSSTFINTHSLSILGFIPGWDVICMRV